MNAPKIRSVTPIKGKRLLVNFANGIQKVYDCHRILHLDRFRLLQHEAFFKAVTVDPGGCGVSWDDEMDLSEYELWTNGEKLDLRMAHTKEAAVVPHEEQGYRTSALFRKARN